MVSHTIDWKINIRKLDTDKAGFGCFSFTQVSSIQIPILLLNLGKEQNYLEENGFVNKIAKSEHKATKNAQICCEEKTIIFLSEKFVHLVL